MPASHLALWWSKLFVFVFVIWSETVCKSNGFVQFQTVKSPEAGQPVNVELVLPPAPQFLSFFMGQLRPNESSNHNSSNSHRRDTTKTEPTKINIRLPGRIFTLFNNNPDQHNRRNDNVKVPDNHISKTEDAQATIVSSASGEKSSQSLDPVENELFEESLSTQMETLGDVLSAQMSQKTPAVTTANVANNASAFSANPAFLPDLSVLGQLFSWGRQSARTYAVCNACKVAMGLLINRAHRGVSYENLSQMATFGCSFFHITSDEMCEGLVSQFGPILFYIVMEKPTLTAERFCGITLQSSGCSTTDPHSIWSIDLNQYNRILEGPTTGSQENYELMPKKRSIAPPLIIPKDIPTIKVLHLTDMHIDPHYRTGAAVDCEHELCCHEENVNQESTRKQRNEADSKAGYFGSYGKCDLPYHSFINALQHISSTHPDIKMIYLTGDFPPHNIWKTSRAANVEIIANASHFIDMYFPNVTIIPVIGNHETHPVNLFSPFGVPAEISTEWLYESTARIWSKWLPKSSIHNFMHAGFYDVEIDPYLKVIVLNTNLCYTLNFWQSFEHRDPGGQLRWLTRELQKSEDLGQFVHILGHVPPGQEDCWTVWSKNFYDIISRYSNIIKAQFYGHTHFDEFKLYYHNGNRSHATVPTWMGASLTPYANLNPGYKIFTIDGARGAESTWNILDHETWIYNLTQANLNPDVPPKWFKLYTATEAFEIPDVLPYSLNELVHRMSANSTVFDTFYRFYHKNSDVALKEKCDMLCRKRILCNIVTPHYGRAQECVQLQSEVDGLVLPNSIFVQVAPNNPLNGQGVHSTTRVSPDASPLQRALSFGRSLLKVLGL